MTLDRRTYTILIIEDNPGDLLLIQDYLEDLIANPVLTNALSFSEATEQLQQNRFDVVLLDLSLPDCSREELISGIKWNAKGTPIIVLTGYSDFTFGVKSISLGMSDYLLKDEITANSLYKSIVYSIERKRIANQLRESEKRYFDLFHLSPQPMWVYDLETLRYLQVNQAAIRRYGFSEKEFLTMGLLDLRRQEEYEQVLVANQYLQDSPDTPYMGRFRHQTKSGELLFVDIYSSLITSGDKKYGLVIGIDVTESVLFDNKITKAIIQAQEEERYEIGSELHDNVCQILATSNLRLGLIEDYLDGDGIAYFEQSKEMINLALKEIRNLSHRLAPVFYDVTCIEETFDKLLSTFNIDKAYTIHLDIGEEFHSRKLPNEIHLNLFRILQEQLRNILKYAEARIISVQLHIEDQELKMRIIDNGIGFNIDEVKGGIGIANMKRRVELFSGVIQIHSAPGQGCRVEIAIPLGE